jgi:hypothetical protein
VLACLLVALVVIDGTREINDYRLGGAVSPWQVPATALSFDTARDGFVRELPERLKQAPVSRPARVPAATTAEPNASGWIADAYHETDYDPTLERVLWEAENNPQLSALLLEPWHGYTFPCAAVGCSSGKVHLPPPQAWKPSSSVHTLSYGMHGIVYTVDIDKPTLMVENELAIRGWSANAKEVDAVSAGIPLRAWRLSPGRYRFTATFHEPDRPLQYLGLSAALIGWLGCGLALARKPAVRLTKQAA